jgi:dGTPase
MKGHGGFNHNYQSYRVIHELEARYPEWNGLNLTFETLEGIAKHETEYDLSEAVGFNVETRGAVESQIANIADELAYNAHDLDDGLQANLIQPDDLNALEIWRDLCERLDWRGGPMDEITRHRFIREQIGMQVTDVLETSMEALNQLNPQSPEDVQKQSENVVRHSDTMKRRNRQLKDFLYQNMYNHYSVVRMQKRAERFIEAIFASFIEEPKLLPEKYRRIHDENEYYRAVADYIASLTDRSALIEYRSLFDPLTRI